jgi:8-oxo-dGTP pyrophosphatase MutT (NUDIX family)
MMAMDQGSRHSVSVARVILDDQGRALLIQRRDSGHWEAPGGILELDEDITTGLRREVHEETGLRLVDGDAAPEIFDDRGPVFSVIAMRDHQQ